jgi:hypothetical protein
MTILNTPEELLNALAGSLFAPDPLADLTRRGFSMTHGLHQQLETALAGRKLAPVPPGVTPGSIKSKLTFLGNSPKRPNVAPGDFDIVAGVRLELANVVIQNLYQSGLIPHQLALDQFLSQGDLSDLESIFAGNPSGSHISRLHILSGPTLAPLRDGSPVVTAKVPFQLDWVRVIQVAGKRVVQLAATGTGTLKLTMKVVAEVSAGFKFIIQVQRDTDTSAADSPRLEMNPASTVQLKAPAPPDEFDLAAAKIQKALADHFSDQLTWSTSPRISLPFRSLVVQQVETSTDKDVLLAGVRVVGGATTGPGDPQNLKSRMPGNDLTLFLQVHSEVVNQLIKGALANGELAKVAKEKNPNVELLSASAWFENNAMVVQLNGTLVNECPFNTDLDFQATHTVSLRFLGSSVEINQDDHYDIFDLSNLGCLLATVGVLELNAIEVYVLDWVSIGVWQGMFGFLTDQPEAFLTLQTIDFLKGLLSSHKPETIDLNKPIDGTDFLPVIKDGFTKTENGALLVAVIADTLIDELNTFIYARFLVEEGAPVAFPTPLVNVKVELMDQDLPAPAGDDVAKVNLPPDRTIGDNTIHYSYQPPTGDQVLARGFTDQDGIVRFAVIKDDLTTSAGTITRVVKNRITGVDPDHTVVTPVNEFKPDLYFRVTMPDGSVVDTRKLPGGFMPNFTSGRVGFYDKPLTFNLGPGKVVTAGNG